MRVWLNCLRYLCTLEHKKSKIKNGGVKLYISQVLLVGKVQEINRETTFG